MTRSEARETALQIVFEMGFGSPYAAANWRLSDEGFASLAEQGGVFELPADSDSREYIHRLVEAVANNTADIDGYISKYSKGWQINRLSRVCLAVLRVCICELRYMEDVPAAVAINEAVRLSKKYDDEEAPAFVNGVLGAYYRGEHDGKTPEAPSEGDK